MGAIYPCAKYYGSVFSFTFLKGARHTLDKASHARVQSSLVSSSLTLFFAWGWLSTLDMSRLRWLYGVGCFKFPFPKAVSDQNIGG